MNQGDYSARRFLIGSAVAVVVLSAIIAVAAVWTVLPWGGADETVREALPESMGQTSAPN